MLAKNAQSANREYKKTADKSSKSPEVTKEKPCRHCGKPDWCYRVSGSNLEVCKRGESAKGWRKTSKMDDEGSCYLAPVNQQKRQRLKHEKQYLYNDRDGGLLVKVVRVDDGNGNKKIWQEHHNNGHWEKGLGDTKREDIPVYLHNVVKVAYEVGQPIFIAGGEA